MAAPNNSPVFGPIDASQSSFPIGAEDNDPGMAPRSPTIATGSDDEPESDNEHDMDTRDGDQDNG